MKRIYGNLTRSFIDKINTDYLVFAFSSKYKRNVNTHKFSDKEEAILTRNDINGNKNLQTR